ncbi:MAG: hypothetical protein ACPGLR_01340 [Flavobacteriaceae bacterium]
MKNSVALLLLFFSISLYAQNTQNTSDLQNAEVIAMEPTDTLQTKVHRLSVGAKIGMPNIVGGSLEFVLPLLDNHLAPYADFSGFDINPEEGTEVGLSYTEFGVNYYFNNTGKGLYISGGLGTLSTDLAFTNIEVESNSGQIVNDGIGTIKETVATTNLKVGIKTGGRFYFRFELGYGFGDIPDALEINASSPSLGISVITSEEFPDIPGLSNGGVIIGNIGFGLSF